jgi:hypothetical protein
MESCLSESRDGGFVWSRRLVEVVFQVYLTIYRLYSNAFWTLRVHQSIMHIVTTLATRGNTIVNEGDVHSIWVLIVVIARSIFSDRLVCVQGIGSLLVSIWCSACLLFIKISILGITSCYWITFWWFCEINLVVRYRLVLI